MLNKKMLSNIVTHVYMLNLENRNTYYYFLAIYVRHIWSENFIFFFWITCASMDNVRLLSDPLREDAHAVATLSNVSVVLWPSA